MKRGDSKSFVFGSEVGGLSRIVRSELRGLKLGLGLLKRCSLLDLGVEW